MKNENILPRTDVFDVLHRLLDSVYQIFRCRREFCMTSRTNSRGQGFIFGRLQGTGQGRQTPEGYHLSASSDSKLLWGHVYGLHY